MTSIDARTIHACELGHGDLSLTPSAWVKDPDGCVTQDTAQTWTVQGWADKRWATVTTERSREDAVALMASFAATKQHFNTYRVKAGTPAVRGVVVAACHVEYLDDETNLDALVRVLPGTVG